MSFIPEGQRDKLLTSLAGSLARRGLTEEQVFDHLQLENEERCHPPLAERQVRKIAHSIYEREQRKRADDGGDDAPLHELNEIYAVIQVGKDVVILQRSEDRRSFELLSERAFRLLYCNRFIMLPTDDGEARRVLLTHRWLAWEHRRQYARLVFKPGETDVPDNEFNLWLGWAIAPNADESCRLFLRHLLKIVCCGNLAHYEWFLDWLADIVQHPQRKLGHLVALRGPQGTGKSLVGTVMEKILGVYQLVVEKPEHIVGRFNAHLALCLLLQAEEAFWGGDRRARGVLKHLVSGRSQQIERKGIDAVAMPNYTRLLITSNEEWVWPTELGDRRLVIFEVKATHKGDAPYFDALFAEIEHGGAAAFMHLLLNRTINEARLKVPPVTRALREQALLTMPAEESWVLKLLTSGRLPQGWVDEHGRAHVPVKALHEHYTGTVPRGQFVKNEEAFGIFLKTRLPRVRDVKYRGPHRYWSPVSETHDDRRRRVQSRGRVIAPLAICRKRYSAQGRAAPQTWSKPTDWKIEA